MVDRAESVKTTGWQSWSPSAGLYHLTETAREKGDEGGRPISRTRKVLSEAGARRRFGESRCRPRQPRCVAPVKISCTGRARDGATTRQVHHQ